jgi:uncharacterized membrane protein
MLYPVVKFLHVVGATALLGTGVGIAFFMLMAHLDGRPLVVAGVARIVVIADFVFTATAVIAQPITGALLAVMLGYSVFESWIALSIVLYVLAGAFWLPVVWMQTRMRDLARKAVDACTPLPPAYHRLFRSGSRSGFRHLRRCWGSFG